MVWSYLPDFLEIPVISNVCLKTAAKFPFSVTACSIRQNVNPFSKNKLFCRFKFVP